MPSKQDKNVTNGTPTPSTLVEELTQWLMETKGDMTYPQWKENKDLNAILAKLYAIPAAKGCQVPIRWIDDAPEGITSEVYDAILDHIYGKRKTGES